MQNNFLQIGVVVLIIALLVSLTDPFMVLMPPPLAMTVMVLATILVSVFGAFVLKERADDEREALLRLDPRL